MPRTPHEGDDVMSVPAVADAHSDEADEFDTVFEWTQYPGHGPAEDILGRPATALELGCGNGLAAAHLALPGVKVTGLDVSDAHIAAARGRWEGIDELNFVAAEACEYLAATQDTYDAVYSIWGAVWFCEPDRLLPLIAERLNPGGVLVFSQAEPEPGHYGPSMARVRGAGDGRTAVRRWNLAPETWAAHLVRHGFEDLGVHIHPAPHPGDMGTLMGRGYVPG